jgi:hypothetical protein
MVVSLATVWVSTRSDPSRDGQSSVDAVPESSADSGALPHTRLTVTTTDVHAPGNNARVPARYWTSAVVASVAAAFGAPVAGLLFALDLVTSLTLWSQGVAVDENGTPLRGVPYLWERYGFWLSEGVLALGIMAGLVATWLLLVRGRGPASFWCALGTCCACVVPWLVGT